MWFAGEKIRYVKCKKNPKHKQRQGFHTSTFSLAEAPLVCGECAELAIPSMQSFPLTPMKVIKSILTPHQISSMDIKQRIFNLQHKASDLLQIVRAQCMLQPTALYDNECCLCDILTNAFNCINTTAMVLLT